MSEMRASRWLLCRDMSPPKGFAFLTSLRATKLTRRGTPGEKISSKGSESLASLSEVSADGLKFRPNCANLN